MNTATITPDPAQFTDVDRHLCAISDLCAATRVLLTASHDGVDTEAVALGAVAMLDEIERRTTAVSTIIADK